MAERPQVIQIDNGDMGLIPDGSNAAFAAQVRYSDGRFGTVEVFTGDANDGLWYHKDYFEYRADISAPVDDSLALHVAHPIPSEIMADPNVLPGMEPDQLDLDIHYAQYVVGCLIGACQPREKDLLASPASDDSIDFLNRSIAAQSR